MFCSSSHADYINEIKAVLHPLQLCIKDIVVLLQVCLVRVWLNSGFACKQSMWRHRDLLLIALQ